MAKTLEEYLALPYTIVLRRDIRDGIVVARVEELPRCSAHGDTEIEALSNLRENMGVWIGDCLESGDPVPEPAEEIELPSGKWLQRVPRSLHLKLIRLAKDESVSLNQFITAVLAEAAGERAARSSEALSASVGVWTADPWSTGAPIGQIVWDTNAYWGPDRRKRDHSIRILARKVPARDVNSIGRGPKSGDEETHENWRDQLVKAAGR